MKKTTNDELNQWHFQYPSTTVSWNFIPDPASCQQFVGEAKNMLYRLKNRMNIAVPKLKSLQDIRSSKGGTIITVRSIYGQDFIEIDASRAFGLGRDQRCTITFYDFPLYIPPMRNPGKLLPEEIQGVDYFKTYYSVDISKCPTCQKMSWEFLFRYLQSSPLVPLPEPPLPISTRIEWPIEPLHHHDYDEDGLLLDHDGYDHTIYSMSPPAWGEVISQGSDSDGTYIIWKAYTETELISRTGLGIMRMVARIRDNTGKEICAQNERIEVDCCIKSDEDRPVVIHWEKCIISEWCPAPDSAPMSVLAYFQSWSWILMNLKANGDGCLPYEWSLSGMGEIIPTWGDKKFVTYKVPAAEFYARDCRAQLIIKGEDRCGTSDSLSFKSCCDSDPTPLEINYTSLIMGCGASQTLTPGGGCGPYSWAVTGGGGTITQGGVYTAPATNPNCGSNPTITLTECCGQSATLKLAINCYETPADALLIGRWVDTGRDSGCGLGGESGVPRTRIEIYYDYYDCNGNFRRSDFVYWPCLCESTGTWANTPPWCNKTGTGPSDCDSPVAPGFCVLSSAWYADGQMVDVRSTAMKAAGCCPLNPLTGLPY